MVSFVKTIIKGVKMEIKKYYSSRNNKQKIALSELHSRLNSMYLYFKDKDFFKENTKIYANELPDSINNKAGMLLGFKPFPIDQWEKNVSEDKIFDVIEFLYDHVSKPGDLVDMPDDGNWIHQDYQDYDGELGKQEFRKNINSFLCQYRDGYELTENGEILSLGGVGGEQFFADSIKKFKDDNVDLKVEESVKNRRNGDLDLSRRKDAITDLVDVFEY